MALRPSAVLPRLVLVLLAFALGTAALTFAAAKRMADQSVPPATTATQQPTVLVVPDVKGQAYVFAKGILQDAGFAWRLGPGARGFAPYTVLSQSPGAGTRVLDTGAPLITLRLARTAGYKEAKHTPDDGSPYAGTAIRSADLATVVKPAKAKVASKPAKTAPARKPDFTVPGARTEPAAEPPLTVRAQRLGAWVAAHPVANNANVHHWLYQHAWIVDGAKFGWWDGAQALRTLIAVDQRVQREWGIGGRSEAEARAALGFVESHRR